MGPQHEFSVVLSRSVRKQIAHDKTVDKKIWVFKMELDTTVYTSSTAKTRCMFVG